MGRARRARAGRMALVGLVAIAGLVALFAAPAQGAVGKRVLEGYFCEPGGLEPSLPCAPEIAQPQALAVDHDSGELYVLDALFRNEVQSLTFNSVVAGDKFTIGNLPPACENSVTAEIEHSASGTTRREQIDNALEAACTGAPPQTGIVALSQGDFAVSTSVTPAITFQGMLRNAPQALLSCPIVTGAGSCTVAETTAGHTPSISRWHEDGSPSPFPELGTNVIDGRDGPDAVPGGPGFVLPPPGGAASRKQVQIAIDESGTATDGNIYLTQIDSRLLHVFAADGGFLTQLSKFKEGKDAGGPEADFGGGSNAPGPCGVAVDESGALYVGDFGQSLVHKYVASAAPPLVTPADNVANFDGLDKPCTMAAGAGPSDGLLFVNTNNDRDTHRLDNSNGEKLGPPLVLNNENTVAVSPASGNVFVGEGFNEVKEFDGVDPEPVEPISTLSRTEVRGFAPSTEGDRLYVSPPPAGPVSVEVFGAPLPQPIVVTDPASGVSETAATLNGTVDRQGLETDDCEFEYIADADYRANEQAKVDPFSGNTAEACAESTAEIDAGAEPFPVHLDLTGLAAGELFHFRLSASTEAGTVRGEELTFATKVPPTIEAEGASAITDSQATIRALVNPKFYATTYRVEYGPGSSFELSTPETSAGSGGAPQPVSVPLSGLSPGTLYEWRIVATSKNGETTTAARSFVTYRPFVPDTACPNQALRVGVSAALPDCRAYEMVSPVDKNGGDIINPGNGSNVHDAWIQATPDGDRIAYTSGASFADQLSTRYYNQYIGARGEGGWGTTGVNVPLGRQLPGVIRFEREVSGFSEDLCSMWLFDYNFTPLTADAQDGFNNLYRRDNCAPGEGALEAQTIAAPHAGAVLDYVNNASVQGFSADGSATFFAAKAKLTADAPTPSPAQPFNYPSQVYLRIAGDPQLRLVSILPSGLPASGGSSVGGGSFGDLRNAVSDDGTRVFWSTGALYARLNPAEHQPGGEECVDPGDACTVAVSESAAATFWDARPDGSAALYSEGGKLYRFDVATAERTELADGLTRVAGASENLSRVYLVTGKDHDGGGPAEEGKDNLYLRDGAGFTFIATLPGPVTLSQTRVTPDGAHIVFESRAQLTGYDNADADTGEAATEVFLYGIGEGLRCVSCNPAGVRPLGAERPKPYIYPFTPEGKGSGIRAAAWIPSWEHGLHASRILSEDGGRVFFHSFDALVPRDTNGTVQDVYQWEAAGTGGCEAGDPDYFEQNEGCVSLISSGGSSYEAEFFDADADGSDVFFTTEAKLVDDDPGKVDLYDARVGGGYPAVAKRPECEGEACQSPAPAPDADIPASSSFKGPENIAPRRDCRPAARGASRLSRQAKRLRRRAGRATNPRATKRLRRAAQRRARQAKRKSRAAKRCRRANRRAAR